MNVLSLFDGISCGRIALDRARIPVTNYYASEIDKHAIKVSLSNYPDIINIGSVTDIDLESLPIIHLLIGGSPCQGFSFAGKQLNFNDDRSKLFFDYVRVLNYLKVKNPSMLFFMENVNMKKQYRDVISEYLGVQPLMINSGLLSAQNRKRLYWMNIEYATINEDLGLVLNDIIQPDCEVDTKFHLSEKMMIGFNRRYSSAENGFDFTIGNPHKKTRTICARYGKDGKECIVRVGNVNPSKNGMNGEVYDTIGKSPELTTNKGEGIKVKTSDCHHIADIDSKFKSRGRIYSTTGKSPCLTTVCGGHQETKIQIGNIFRKLTPIECERLQTIPDNYTVAASNSQRYKMIGNAWTVDIIAHIFKSIPK